ncbi:MAG: PD-(D/E)XK nuclease domain-containing protein [Thermoleophilia bacterium]
MSDEIEFSNERLPTYAFGYEFTHIPDFVRDDLSSLERENVLYTDHWIDELDDFRHVRIRLTEEEARDYARRTWAYELFLRAEHPEWARDVDGIDEDVARDADSYSSNRVDGTIIPPPWHCFAAFLGRHLEWISCIGPPDRTTVLELQGKESALLTLQQAVHALTPTIRSFERRETGLVPWPVRREDDVRDLLYVMLRPALFDLVKEEPTPSLALTHKYVDLCSKASRTFIEVKWIAKKNSWKRILNEIHVDVQCYPSHAACETLVFVIVDTVRDVPDPRLVEQNLSGRQMVREKEIDVRVWVVEP